MRQTKLELAKAGKTQKDIATQGENNLKKQAMEARKSEKDLTARHKRQLDDMRGDMDKRQVAVQQELEELYRQGIQKTREVLRNCEMTQTELAESRAEKSQLVKIVRRGTATLESVQKDGWDGRRSTQRCKTR